MKEQSIVTLLKDNARPLCYVLGTNVFSPIRPAIGIGPHYMSTVTDVGWLYRTWGAT